MFYFILNEDKLSFFKKKILKNCILSAIFLIFEMSFNEILVNSVDLKSSYGKNVISLWISKLKTKRHLMQGYHTSILKVLGKWNINRCFFGESNGLIFASENNSDLRRGGGGKDKMKPCSPRRIFCLLFLIKQKKWMGLGKAQLKKDKMTFWGTTI